MSTPRLTETSFAVMGMLSLAGEATPYDLKQAAQASLFNFWSVPHTQIYTECERLADAGLLRERREKTGRRRRFYRLSAAGRKALERWQAEPSGAYPDIRDPGTLKLFFGADPKPLAAAQLAVHKEKLEEARQVVDLPGLTPGMRLATELGIDMERALVRFWSRLAEKGSPG